MVLNHFDHIGTFADEQFQPYLEATDQPIQHFYETLRFISPWNIQGKDQPVLKRHRSGIHITEVIQRNEYIKILPHSWWKMLSGKRVMIE